MEIYRRGKRIDASRVKVSIRIKRRVWFVAKGDWRWRVVNGSKSLESGRGG